MTAAMRSVSHYALEGVTIRGQRNIHYVHRGMWWWGGGTGAALHAYRVASVWMQIGASERWLQMSRA